MKKEFLPGMLIENGGLLGVLIAAKQNAPAGRPSFYVLLDWDVIWV